MFIFFFVQHNKIVICYCESNVGDNLCYSRRIFQNCIFAIWGSTFKPTFYNMASNDPSVLMAVSVICFCRSLLIRYFQPCAFYWYLASYVPIGILLFGIFSPSVCSVCYVRYLFNPSVLLVVGVMCTYLVFIYFSNSSSMVRYFQNLLYY